MSGGNVVWLRYLDTYTEQVVLKEGTSAAAPVATFPRYDQNVPEPRISGNTVVWHDGNVSQSNIRSYTIATGQTSTLTSTGQPLYPAISGSTVVWQDSSGTVRSNDPNVPLLGSGVTSVYVHGNVVAWEDRRNGLEDIYGFRLDTRNELSVAVLPSGQSNPAVGDDAIVFDSGGGPTHIYGYRISTGDLFPVCTAPGSQSFPAISGNIAVWQDTRNGASDIYGMDLLTGEEFPVSVHLGNSARYPNIDGNTIVWETLSGIQGATIMPEPTALVLMSLMLFGMSARQRRTREGVTSAL